MGDDGNYYVLLQHGYQFGWLQPLTVIRSALPGVYAAYLLHIACCVSSSMSISRQRSAVTPITTTTTTATRNAGKLRNQFKKR